MQGYGSVSYDELSGPVVCRCEHNDEGKSSIGSGEFQIHGRLSASRNSDRTGWCRGNALGLFLGDAWLESEPVQLSCGFHGFP